MKIKLDWLLVLRPKKLQPQKMLKFLYKSITLSILFYSIVLLYCSVVVITCEPSSTVEARLPAMSSPTC